MRKKKDTALVVQQSQQQVEVNSFIEKAIASNLPVETLEKLFALREKVKAETAKEAFISSLARFQGECPTIKKTKAVKDYSGNVRYYFAQLDSIASQISAPLARNSLAYRWITEHIDNHMRVTCIVTHVLGHSEASSMDIPIFTPTSKEGKATMTAPQTYQSAVTYAKRQTLLNSLGIATADEDTDATDSKKPVDAKSPKAQIMLRLRALKEKTDTPEQIKEAIMRLTGLDSSPKTHAEIAAKLQLIIDENNQA